MRFLVCFTRRLCSGNQYEDNKENTYYYPAGANVPINVFILNVSLALYFSSRVGRANL